MPRPSIGETVMTVAERQARYRTTHANGAPVIRIRRPVDRRSRIQRWNDTIAAAVDLQAEYAGWLDALPDNQQDSGLADALRAIVELDLSELQAAIDAARSSGTSVSVAGGRHAMMCEPGNVEELKLLLEKAAAMDAETYARVCEATHRELMEYLQPLSIYREHYRDVLGRR